MNWKKNNLFLKKGRSEEYQYVNNPVWRWLCMTSEALTCVLGPTIRDESFQIKLKLDITGFIVLNRWLEKWKTRHNTKQFSVSGENGKVNAKTLGSTA